jgi:hypothetical protein
MDRYIFPFFLFFVIHKLRHDSLALIGKDPDALKDLAYFAFINRCR